FRPAELSMASHLKISWPFKISCSCRHVTHGRAVAKLHRTTIGGTHAVAPDHFARPCCRPYSRHCFGGRPSGRGRALHFAWLLVMPAGERLSQRACQRPPRRAAVAVSRPPFA